MKINLQNFDQRGRTKPILDSPRSIEACKRQGIEPEQLIIRDINYVKKTYNDGMNDKKSLQIKLQHYEKRRKQKIILLKAQREKLISQGFDPNQRLYNSRTTSRNRISIRQVDNVLEKKKLMDQVKTQIKRKQLQMKELAIQQKKANIERQKLQKQLEKQQQRKQMQYRKNCNLLKNQVIRQAKINNLLQTQKQKAHRIQLAKQQKRLQISNEKKLKEQFYQQKLREAESLKQQQKLQKQRKIYLKMQELEGRLSKKQAQQLQKMRSIEEQKRKDLLWKETKRKQKQIEQQKKKIQMYQALRAKQQQKQEYLQKIQDKKRRYYEMKKEDHQIKENVVRQRLSQAKMEEQKKRRILELKDQIERQQLQRLRQQKIQSEKARRQELIQKQKIVKQRLQEEEQERRRNAAYILERQKQKQEQVQSKKKQLQEENKRKYIQKVIREKEIQQNKKRLQRIDSYEKLKNLQAYEEKVKEISRQKANRKVQTLVRSVSKNDIEQKLWDEESRKMRNRSSVDLSLSRSKDVKIKPITSQTSMMKSRQQLKQVIQKEQIEKIIENLKIQLLKQEHEMMIGQDAVEKQRLQREKTAQTVTELKRLRKIHQFQREQFRESLNEKIKQNQERINKYRKQLEA